MLRDMKPMTEDQIVELLHEHDRTKNITPQMNLASFLLDLYMIVPLGQAHCNTKQCADIFNLRLQREGIEKHDLYTDASVRQKVFAGTQKLKKEQKSMEEVYNDPEGTSVLFPLSDEEQQIVFGGTVGNQHWFLVRDALTVNLTKPAAKEEPPKEPKKRGRQAVREPRQRRTTRGRPPSSRKGRMNEITQRLIHLSEANDLEGIQKAIEELKQLQQSEEEKPEPVLE